MLLQALFEKQTRLAYHVAPSKHDSVIRKHGIQGRNDQIYVWADLEYAYWFAELHRDDGIPMTIWMVDVSDFELQRDPEAEDMNGVHGSNRINLAKRI